MNFAGKAYIKKKQVILPPMPKKIEEEVKEEVKIETKPISQPIPTIKRNRSFEALSISSLNHSLNSDSGSGSGIEDEDEERDEVPEIPPPASKKIEMRIDTNVVSIELSSLKTAVIMATGDPVFCEQCKIAFNMYSRISEIDEFKQLWKCEFCGWENYVNIDAEEIPRGDMLDYMLMSSQQVVEEKKDIVTGAGITVVFCIDISGSMCVTEPVTGKIHLKNKKVVDLGGFEDFDMEEQFLEGDDCVTYVSRLECVQAAIEAQLQTLAQVCPTQKIGLVTFNSEVTIHGDGSGDPVIIAGNKMNSFENCYEIGVANQHKMNNTIKDTKEGLIKKLMNLNETGPTALGPALISSVGIASEGLPGSRVIICTDGLANVGIGRLDDNSEEAEDFYSRVANIAKDKGIEISVISIEGEECKLSKLSKVCEITGGEVTRVNMMNIANEFANILETPVIATQVSVVVKIHKGFCFRYQDDYLVDVNTLKRELGNVSEDGSEFTFEYSVRSQAELESLNIDLTEVTNLPFQSQIHYTNTSGMRCMRVITALQEIIDDLSKAGNINLKVIGVNAAQRSAHLASKGEYRESQAVMRSWKRMMKRNAHSEEQKDDVNYYLHNMAMFNQDLNDVAFKEAGMESAERVSSQNDKISHMAFRAKKARKENKKDCVIM
ncbi:hypothetical protein SteCoe_32061 [Stentor coeruleus]|uniref:VWFA domain-containing protein n=1 Tax=Stentor coeruleus TaxID=5963 RepID=A0A1R2AZW9_9CILI|nr:hypothetical protein SteCoe_32061 [Stentor coeruleus]